MGNGNLVDTDIKCHNNLPWQEQSHQVVMYLEISTSQPLLFYDDLCPTLRVKLLN